jgi:ABC-2 type transport system ATP-binding protein
MTSEGIVVAQGIRKVYMGGFPRREHKTALDDVTFSIPRGTIFALLGPNGAGKSTTIHLLLGFFAPTSGTIRVCGHEPVSPLSRSSLGFLAEVFAFDRFSTGRRLLEQFDALTNDDRGSRKMRVDDALELVDLTADADRKVGTYSKGMTQRIGLAQALLGDPDLLILDEPMSGMDPASRRAVKDILVSRRTRGRTTLLSSHILADIEELADQVLILDQGRVVINASIHELRSRSASVRIAFQISSEDRTEGIPAELLVRARAGADGGSFTLDCLDNELTATLAKLTDARARILAVNPTRGDLESVFLAVTDAKSSHRKMS